MKPKIILDSKHFEITVTRLCYQLIEVHNDFSKTVIIGLQPRGIYLANRIQKKLSEYEKMDDVSFQFLNAAVGKMSFGIKELRKKCTECGMEVHTENTFPDRPSDIFVIRNAFEKYLKK